MPKNAYYTCNLLPLELVARTGYSPRWLGEHLQDPGAPARRDALSVHPMTCPYVTRLVAAADALFDHADDGDVLLVPGGCDAMRRMGDLLAAVYPGRVFVVSLGRSSGDGVAETLAADLARMEAWLLEKASATSGTGGTSATVAGGTSDDTAAPNGATPAGADPTGSPAKQTPAVDYPSPPRPGGVFVVAGPLTDDSLLRLIERLGATVSGLESCTSPERWKPLAKAGVTGAASGADDVRVGAPGADRAAPTDGFLALAREVLALGMCPRRSTVERHKYLVRRLDESRPSSVIYARQSFCDPGAYDAVSVSQLAEERGLPYLEIEVGFPFEAGGPLQTRVEAFLEAQSLDDDLLDFPMDDDLLGEED
jgi:2-hydroxyglutaryl-CoA dehydratase, D-component